MSEKVTSTLINSIKRQCTLAFLLVSQSVQFSSRYRGQFINEQIVTLYSLK